MFEHPPQSRQRVTKVAASLAAHCGLLVLLIHHGAPLRVTHPALQGTSRGSHIELAYQPGRASLKTLPQHAERKPVTLRPTPVAVKQLRPSPADSIPPAASTLSPPPPRPHLDFSQPPPAAGHVQAVAPDSTTGSDSLGSGNILMALTTYSPSPKPDLSRLPHGTQGDVVLDVTIDPSGNVAEVAVLRTLGYGIDEAVINIVRTWRFHPATRDGVPVASAQDVLFHFGPV